MTQGNIDALQIVLNSDAIMGALRSVFREAADRERPTAGIADNGVLGERYRAYETAQNILEKAFSELEMYRKPQKDGVGYDRAE